MLDQHLQDSFIENEVERIELFFIDNKYNEKQKLIYLNKRLYNAEKNNDELLLKVCNILFNKIKKD